MNRAVWLCAYCGAPLRPTSDKAGDVLVCSNCGSPFPASISMLRELGCQLEVPNTPNAPGGGPATAAMAETLAQLDADAAEAEACALDLAGLAPDEPVATMTLAGLAVYLAHGPEMDEPEKAPSLAAMMREPEAEAEAEAAKTESLDSKPPEDVSNIITGLDDKAARGIRPILLEGLRRAISMQIENAYYDDVTNGEIFRDLFASLVASVPGLGWRVYDLGRGKWLDDFDRLYVRHLAALVGILRRKAIGLSDDTKAASKHAAYTSSAYGIRSMLSIAECEPRLIVQREAFDRDPDIVLDAEGNKINLRTGEAEKARPGDLFTRSLGIAYDLAATCPIFDRFILEVMSGDAEAVTFLRRWIGYSFTGRTSEQKILVNVGGGRNGKGTLSNLIEYIAGDYAATIKADAFAPDKGQGPAYEIAELPGVRMAIMKETAKGAWLNESLVKVSTGSDTIAARRPYERPFTFIPQFKPWIETNDAPRIRSRGLAIWRRILRLDWTFTPEHEDQELGAKLRAEAPGILNWILAGAREWYDEGLGMPRRIADAVVAYKDRTDILADFLAGFARGPTLTAPSGELYTRYKTWAQESGSGTLSAAKFKDELEERGIAHARTRHGKIFEGISLLPPSDPQPEDDKQEGPALDAPADELDFSRPETEPKVAEGKNAPNRAGGVALSHISPYSARVGEVLGKCHLSGTQLLEESSVSAAASGTPPQPPEALAIEALEPEPPSTSMEPDLFPSQPLPDDGCPNCARLRECNPATGTTICSDFKAGP